MDILIKVLQFVLSFSLLVFIHEMGHFLFARMFKIRVEKFYMFFNPWFSLYKFTYKGTEYGIGWIPFGGYVKIAGMIDESMDTEQMQQPPKPDEFRSKPAWQRLLVMTGGVLMNVVLAMLIYIGMSYSWGDKYIDNKDVVYGYSFSELGQKMGFKNGDKIISVNGGKIGDYSSIFIEVLLTQKSTVEVLRGEERVVIEIPECYTSELIKSKKFFMEPRLPFKVAEVPEGSAAEQLGIVEGDMIALIAGQEAIFIDQCTTLLDSLKGQMTSFAILRGADTITVNGTIPETGKIGILLQPVNDMLKISTRSYSLLESVPVGIKRTGKELKDYFRQIKLIFSPNTEAYKSLGGVIAIGNIFPNFWSWEIFWKITAFLSIILAVMNILPIPALDGGHVMFLLFEVISGRKPSDKFLEYAQMMGLIILFTLLIFANGNDIYRFFIK